MPPLTNRKPIVHIEHRDSMNGFEARCGAFCKDSDKLQLKARKGRAATCVLCKKLDKKDRAIRAGKAYGYMASPGYDIKPIKR